MSGKNLGSLKDQLEPIANDTPSIHQTPATEQGQRTPEPNAPVAERKAQYLLKMRPEQRKQLTKLAVFDDKTIRGFILSALKDKGLDVTDEDMIDLRRTAE